MLLDLEEKTYFFGCWSPSLKFCVFSYVYPVYPSLKFVFPSFNMYPSLKNRSFQPIRFPPTHLALQGGTRLDERHATFGSFGTQESCCVGGLEGGAQRNFRVGQARVVKQADLDFTPPEN